LERSTDQVIKPINPEPLTTWVGKIPVHLLADMSNIAPMLAVLGYDPHANPPNYGKIDDFVRNNMQLIKQQAAEWAEKSQHIEQQRKALKANLVQLSRDFKELKQNDPSAEVEDYYQTQAEQKYN